MADSSKPTTATEEFKNGDHTEPEGGLYGLISHERVVTVIRNLQYEKLRAIFILAHPIPHI